ncbi:hypothetical protein Tco_0925008, partial [Tanacetum coccineum]
EEAARLVHATYEKMEIESDIKPARRRPSEEQLAVDKMQALKASKKSSRRQPNTGDSSKGTSSIPGVLDESTVVFSTSSEGTEESEYNEEDDVDENIDWVGTDEMEEKNDDDDDKSIDLEKIDDEETDDEFVQSEAHMTNAEDANTRNGDEQITDPAKADAEKIEEVKDDIMKAEFPPSSSSLSVSSGFSNQFLNLSYDKSTVENLKDTAYAEINSLMVIKIQSKVPHIQSPSTLTVLVLVIPVPLVLPPIPETTMTAPPVTSIINSVLQQQSTQIPTPPITTELHLLQPQFQKYQRSHLLHLMLFNQGLQI